MTSFNFVSNTISAMKNGHLSGRTKVFVPFSKFIYKFLLVLKDEGYISEVSLEETDSAIKRIIISLKYYRNKGVISDIKVVSKPSRRVYWSVKEFKSFYGGLGLFIISTSRGILSINEARKQNIGGEVLCGIF